MKKKIVHDESSNHGVIKLFQCIYLLLINLQWFTPHQLPYGLEMPLISSEWNATVDAFHGKANPFVACVPDISGYPGIFGAVAITKQPPCVRPLIVLHVLLSSRLLCSANG